MGRKRMFTAEVYEALQSGIADDSVMGGIGDFFANVSLGAQNAFSQFELEEDLGNINQYLHDISDLNNYTQRKLKEIFKNVESVDINYQRIFETQAETINSYKTVIGKLTEAISNKDFTNNFDTSAFLSSITNEKNMLLQTKWKDILSKPANEITQEEYLEIASVLVRIGDVEMLEDILNMCYDYSAAEGNSAGGITVDVVSYTANEKLQGLADAVAMVQGILLANCMAEGIEAQRGPLDNAILFNQLLQKFLPMSESLDIATTVNMSGGTKTSIDRLIELSYNEKGELELRFCQYPGKNQVWIEQQQTVITISPVVTGQSGENRIYDESFQYIAAALETGSVQSAMSEETIKQILSACCGTIPGSGMISAIKSILTAGTSAEANADLVKQCEEIASMGALTDQFQLTYVSSDVNGKAGLHTYSLYPSETTENWVKTFNEFMQHGSGEPHKQGSGYNSLPGGELTMQYLLEHPNEVRVILGEVYDNIKYGSESSKINDELIEIYQEVAE